ncbi:hypothetical protein MMC15_000487 [Xylographa vitiligo]|nr:hypothetical protein [Xylographa vitiligo]
MTASAEAAQTASTALPEKPQCSETPNVAATENATEPQFSTFSSIEKKLYVYIASCAAFASPVSSSIYYPALNIIALDLHTTLANINITITTYMVFQGLAPTIVGGISDRYGRRPAYLICFTVFIGANIGLALQTNYVALLVLRCLQSCGSSGTVALSNGVVSDIATRAERGKYIGYAALGSSLGPALGPIIGGLLAHFLGWRSIFWFLVIYAAFMLTVFVIFIPETCRNIVGNGSVPAQRWNMSLVTYFRLRKQRKNGVPAAQETVQNKRRPGILSSLPILFEKESFLLLFYAGILYAGFYIIMAGLPAQLASVYNYNSIQIGLCYLPIGCGAIVARTTVGRVIDWNFRRHCRKLGIQIVKGKQQNIENFPIERARLEIGLPLVYLGCAAFLPYGWVMSLQNPPLAAVIVLLFLNAYVLSGSFQALNVLVVDCHPSSSAAASAALNLTRCLLGAGGVAAVIPLLDRIGSGWTGTMVTLIWIVASAMWWAPMIWGPQWRQEKKIKEDAKRVKKESGRDVEQAVTTEYGAAQVNETDSEVTERIDDENLSWNGEKD